MEGFYFIEGLPSKGEIVKHVQWLTKGDVYGTLK